MDKPKTSSKETKTATDEIRRGTLRFLIKELRFQKSQSRVPSYRQANPTKKVYDSFFSFSGTKSGNVEKPVRCNRKQKRPLAGEYHPRSNPFEATQFLFG